MGLTCPAARPQRPFCQSDATTRPSTTHRCRAQSLRGSGASGPSSSGHTGDAAACSTSRRAVLAALPTTGLLWRQLQFMAAAGGSLLVTSSAPEAAHAASGGPVIPSDAVKAALEKALSKTVTKQKAPVLLRLAYHDAGTFSASDGSGGINASIRFELDRPENFGLKRGWKLIEQMASDLKSTPAQGAVSLADLIAHAGARAVFITGGPMVPNLPIGRVDAGGPDPEGRLVAETAGVEALKANFAAKGFSVREMVALSGAHTLGGKGFGDPVTFDNNYYTSLLAKPWLDPTLGDMANHIGLPSDHVLPEDPECEAVIKEYATDQSAFFSDFAAAYARLATLGANWA